MKNACSLLLALVLALSTARPADAHSWYPKECCSGRDCMVADRMITDSLGSKSIIVGPYRILVPRGFVPRPSPDGRIHACFIVDDEGSGPELRCLFVPAQG
jgi:hypothetical protein